MKVYFRGVQQTYDITMYELSDAGFLDVTEEHLFNSYYEWSEDLKAFKTSLMMQEVLEYLKKWRSKDTMNRLYGMCRI